MDNLNAESLCPEQRCLRWPPWLILLLMAMFLGMQLMPERPGGWLRMLVLAALLLAAAVWFIACFTGDACRKRDHQFVFAYAFTIGAFALLVAPIMSMAPAQDKEATAVRPPEGVLQLVQGCTAERTAGGQDAAMHSSALTRCPDWVSWTQEPYVPAAGASASLPPRATEIGRQFAWLIAIGGVTSREYAASVPNAAMPASAPAAAQAARPASAPQFVVVHGGLVAPLYVVVLAFIGGAISLSRRLPEYQRRSDVQSCSSTTPLPAQVVKTDPDPLTAVQVREGIVFQLMQLCSAPFLALATWHIFDPGTVAAATTLAFGTGFASEHLLLIVRGMIEGIRPEGSRLAKAGTKD